MSPIALISEKLGINWLMLFEDDYVYGPSPGLIEAADLLLMELKPETVIDLFGGSGAVSKLAIKRGARKVIYVDIFPEAAARNFGKSRRITIIQEDALKFLEGESVKCDFLVADPPEELIDTLLSRIDRIEKIIRKAALIWIGKCVDSKKRIEKLRRERAGFIDAWGDSFTVISKPSARPCVMRVKRASE